MKNYCKKKFFPNFITLIIICVSSTLFAAENQDINISITGVEGDLLENVKNHIVQKTLLKKSTFVIRKNTLEKAEQALNALGYYNAVIDVNYDANIKKLSLIIDPGSPILIKKIIIQLTGDGEEDEAFQDVINTLPLKENDIFHHGRYEAIKSTLKNIATERGYWDANFNKQQVKVDVKNNTAVIDLLFNTGNRYKFGQIAFEDNKLSDKFLNRWLTFANGDFYEQKKLIQLQHNLELSGFFDQVSVNVRREEIDNYHIPITMRFTPKKRYQASFKIGYGTDSSIRGEATVRNHRVNDKGHTYYAGVQYLKTEQQLELGYVIPLKKPWSDKLSFISNATNLNEEIGESNHYEAKIQHEYELKNSWLQTSFLSYEYEEFAIEQENKQTSKLLLPGIGWSNKNSNDPVLPTQGYRWQFAIKGNDDWLVNSLGVRFIQTELSAKWLTTFAEKHRIIARGELGLTYIEEEEFASKMPISLRFRTGGDQSIRGYKYNSLGPKNENGELIGGRHLVVGSIEYEYAIRDAWRVASFIDVGNAFNDPENLDLKRGVGLGLRWISPIGPIRFDVARAIDSPKGWRIHISMGPDL